LALFANSEKTGFHFDPFIEKIGVFSENRFLKLGQKLEKFILLKFDISFKFVFLT
jgi:hypothetical protein